MKAIVSTTNDPLYSFFLPIIGFCWNKLGVDVINFVPAKVDETTYFAMGQLNRDHSNKNESHGFLCPKDKEATYAQCSRLYAAALDLPEDEILITSDVDMAVFRHLKLHIILQNGFTSFGSDLVGPGQMPMCYAAAPVKDWRKAFIKGRTYQQCLDDLLGGIECEHFRGNHWCKDQEALYKGISSYDKAVLSVSRARPGTQFAALRLDRDDRFLLERMGHDVIDYHMPRPGYEQQAFDQICTVLEYMYPDENFEWLKNYRNEYIKLL